jgi:hypothetical protein
MPYRKPVNLALVALIVLSCLTSADLASAAEPAKQGKECKTDSKTPEEVSAYVKNLSNAVAAIRKAAKSVNCGSAST